MRLCCFLFLSFSILFSCASTSQTGSSRSSSSSITAEEIAETTARNAYEALEMLRPNLLRYRGSRGRGIVIEPVVYLDNVKFGDMSSLRSIYVQNIQKIEYLKPNDATTRFGVNHMGGAFVITSKSR